MQDVIVPFVLQPPLLIAAAWLLDAVMGDPECLPHPVKAVGAAIVFLEYRLVALCKNKRAAGVLLGLCVPCGAYVCTAGAISAAHAASPWLGAGLSIMVVATCLSTKGLGSEAAAVLKALRSGRLLAARRQLARIVGRDTLHLGGEEIARAAIESVSENTVDAIVAPLLYAFLGGAPLAVAYKAVNTLDSMVGYKNERYRDLGWFSARLDDAANYVPARLCLVLVPLACLCLHPARAAAALRTGLRDGRKSPSPNSGFPEACFAGAMGIQLGGACSYEGLTHHKPLLGDSTRPLEQDDISRAVRLMWLVSACTLIMFFAVAQRVG